MNLKRSALISVLASLLICASLLCAPAAMAAESGSHSEATQMEAADFDFGLLNWLQDLLGTGLSSMVEAVLGDPSPEVDPPEKAFDDGHSTDDIEPPEAEVGPGMVPIG